MNHTVRSLGAAVAALVLTLPAGGSNGGMEERGFSPEDGAKLSVSAPELSWNAGGAKGGKFLVFVGTDKKKVEEAFYRNHPGVDVFECSESRVKLPELVSGSEYFWRVDLDNEALPLEQRRGRIRRFTTPGGQAAELFSDDFTAAHDYLAAGTAGTIWDGFIGLKPHQSVERLESAGGLLQVASTGGVYQDNAEKLGPLLYRVISVDFKATVRIADYQMISYNNCGIMARVPERGDAGEGEDWVSIDYFPLYGGIYARSSDDGKRDEICDSGQGRAADRYLQLEKLGSLFYLRHSPDGVHWKELSGSPVRRADLAGRPLQVGLFQATYSANRGSVAFDNFTLELGKEIKTARLVQPVDGGIDIPGSVRLGWIAGAGAQSHDLYTGDSRAAVANAGRSSPEYKGRLSAENLEYGLSGLEDGGICYWRVDEISADNSVQRGDVWSFRVYDRNLADFEELVTAQSLEAEWKAAGPVRLAIAEPGAGGSRRALTLESRGGAQPAQAVHRFARNQDWLDSAFDFRRLSLVVRGDPRNKSVRLAVEFHDGEWIGARTSARYTGSLSDPGWTTWEIDLQELVVNNPVFRLTAVSQMALVLSGEGTVTIDNIRVDTVRRTAGGDPWPRSVNPQRFVKPVAFDKVRITGGLWQERMETNRTASLPHVWGKCEYFKKGNGEESRRLDNFRKAAGLIEGGFTGTFFNDSDVYKIIQGTAYSLQNTPDPALEASADQVIEWIAGAQWDDGYLYTHYSIPKKPELRWTNIGYMHELYCAGHLFEAAAAYYTATGKRRLLDVALRFADYLCETFGPDKIDIPPGHQEVELALMQLYHLTDRQRYMDLAKFFIDQRGRSLKGGRAAYHQSHQPFVEQEKGVGHSVRAGYMYCAAADIAMVNHDEAYGRAMERLWDNITNTKTYLTGGIGQPGGPEGFAGDYQLGNDCYAETCSGIAFAMWNHRLHLMSGESRYIDSMERTFYNNTLSSLSICGTEHYYTNPLMTDGRKRWGWPDHDCACCPSSLVRTIASIGGYVYTHTDATVNINMYLQSEAEIAMPGSAVRLRQETGYPWDGDIRISVHPEKAHPFAIRLRIPGWALGIPLPGNLYQYADSSDEKITLALNGKPVDAQIVQGYISLERKWQAGDEIHLTLPMPIRRVTAHPAVEADRGLVAVERGPLVYCAEHCDNNFGVKDLKLSDETVLTAQFEKELFNGVVTISSADGKLKLIPYYLYSNRKPGWMRVWIRRAE